MSKIAEDWENLINRLLLEKLSKSVYHRRNSRLGSVSEPDMIMDSKLVAIAG